MSQENETKPEPQQEMTEKTTQIPETPPMPTCDIDDGGCEFGCE